MTKQSRDLQRQTPIRIVPSKTSFPLFTAGTLRCSQQAQESIPQRSMLGKKLAQDSMNKRRLLSKTPMIALLGKTATVEVNPTLTLPATGKNKTKQQQTLSLIFHVLAVFILALHAPGSDHCMRLCGWEMLSQNLQSFKG